MDYKENFNGTVVPIRIKLMEAAHEISEQYIAAMRDRYEGFHNLKQIDLPEKQQRAFSAVKECAQSLSEGQEPSMGTILIAKTFYADLLSHFSCHPYAVGGEKLSTDGFLDIMSKLDQYDSRNEQVERAFSEALTKTKSAVERFSAPKKASARAHAFK